MTHQRIILEMGSGNDLYGEDYTKAAVRAVQDALHHSSLILFRSLALDHDTMVVDVTIGVQQPEAINTELVKSQIPYGTVNVSVEKGGLNMHDPDNDITTVIATAGIAASVDLPDGRFTLPPSKP